MPLAKRREENRDNLDASSPIVEKADPEHNPIQAGGSQALLVTGFPVTEMAKVWAACRGFEPAPLIVPVEAVFQGLSTTKAEQG